MQQLNITLTIAYLPAPIQLVPNPQLFLKNGKSERFIFIFKNFTIAKVQGLDGTVLLQLVFEEKHLITHFVLERAMKAQRRSNAIASLILNFDPRWR